jgi:hypothetical protein
MVGYYGTSTVANLSICGGTIPATGANRAAGIGFSHAGSYSTSSVTNLSLFGGDVTAFASGYGYFLGNVSVGTITIAGGSIRATGRSGAGIGSGLAADRSISYVGNIAVFG